MQKWRRLSPKSGRSRAIDHLSDNLTPPSDEEQDELVLLESSLRNFIAGAWHVLEPGTDYKHGWHIDAIAEHLEAVTLGQIKRLVINIPPRHMKSLTVSVFWPSWWWIQRPETKFIFSSYSAMLSKRDNGKARQLIESPWFQKRWGHLVKIRRDTNAKGRFENTRTGFRFATSVNAGVTGEGGDVSVADDPHNAKQANSDANLNSVVEWWDGAMSTRLNDPKNGVRLIVMQRLNERDLTGHVLKKGGYEHLCLPAEFDGKRRSTSIGTGRYFDSQEADQTFLLARTKVELTRSGVRADALTINPKTSEIMRTVNYDPRTKEGDLLWENHFGRNELESLKVDLGPYSAAGQLQQDPAPAEGGILKRFWWRFWQRPGMNLQPIPMKRPKGDPIAHPVATLPDSFSEVIQSWDCAVVGTDDASFNVGQVWGRIEANKYLLNQKREQLDLPGLLELVRALTNEHPEAYCKLFENKANGPAVVQTLNNELGGMIAVPPYGDKTARGVAISPQIAAGNVFIPHPDMPGFEWVHEFLKETTRFPFAATGDQVDSMAIALLHFASGFEYQESEMNF